MKLARDLQDSENEAWFVCGRRSLEAELARRDEVTGGAGALNVSRAPIMIRISDVQREEMTWLWSNRIPRGKLTIV